MAQPQPQSNTKPQPTREEYDAAAAKVVESAPAGLSKDEFYALVDKEIERNVATPSAQRQPAAEQPSSMGFLRNLGSDAVRTGLGVIDAGNRALQDPISVAKEIPAGLLRRAKEIGSDIHPSDAWSQLKQGNVGAAVGNILPVAEAYKRPAQMATDIYGGAQLAKLGTEVAKVGARQMARIPRSVTGEVVDPTLPAGVKEGETLTTPRPLREMGETRRLPAGQYEMPPSGASDTLDATGRSVAPAQTSPSGRPSGPWDTNKDVRQAEVTGPAAEAQVTPADLPDTPTESHDFIRRVEGQPEAGPRFSDSMMSTEPSDPHMFGDMDRALASRDELDQASSLHRSGAEMDHRFSDLTDPSMDLGSTAGPEAMLAKLLWQVVKEHVKDKMNSGWSPDLVGRTAGAGVAAVKKLPAFGAIADLTRPEANK